jgi:hypothetical protein
MRRKGQQDMREGDALQGEHSHHHDTPHAAHNGLLYYRITCTTSGIEVSREQENDEAKYSLGHVGHEPAPLAPFK